VEGGKTRGRASACRLPTGQRTLNIHLHILFFYTKVVKAPHFNTCMRHTLTCERDKRKVKRGKTIRNTQISVQSKPFCTGGPKTNSSSAKTALPCLARQPTQLASAWLAHRGTQKNDNLGKTLGCKTDATTLEVSYRYNVSDLPSLGETVPTAVTRPGSVCVSAPTKDRMKLDLPEPSAPNTAHCRAA
jgi:hypothetical protein